MAKAKRQTIKEKKSAKGVMGKLLLTMPQSVIDRLRREAEEQYRTPSKHVEWLLDHQPS
jgi:hypothetical protein